MGASEGAGAPPAPAELATLRLDISTFPAPATTSTAPKYRRIPWAELVALLTHHERRRDKDGAGWSPATYRPGKTRANANVVQWSCAVADVDHQTTADFTALRAHLDALGVAYVIHSTYSSHPPDSLALRVVVPFTRPVPAAQWADIWRRANWYLFDGRNDPQTKDAWPDV